MTYSLGILGSVPYQRPVGFVDTTYPPVPEYSRIRTVFVFFDSNFLLTKYHILVYLSTAMGFDLTFSTGRSVSTIV